MEKQSKLGLANYILQLNSSYGRIKRSGQEHAPENHEKSSRHKNREAKKSSQIGDHTLTERGEGASSGNEKSRPPSTRRIPKSLADWFTSGSKKIGLPDH
jgi:hypothetical protein